MFFWVFHGCEAIVPLGTAWWEYSAVCCLHLMHLTAREGTQNSCLPSATRHLRKNACAWQLGLY